MLDAGWRYDATVLCCLKPCLKCLFAPGSIVISLSISVPKREGCCHHDKYKHLLRDKAWQNRRHHSGLLQLLHRRCKRSLVHSRYLLFQIPTGYQVCFSTSSIPHLSPRTLLLFIHPAPHPAHHNADPSLLPHYPLPDTPLTTATARSGRRTSKSLQIVTYRRSSRSNIAAAVHSSAAKRPT